MFDVGPQRGMGHWSRMSALASALAELGVPAELAPLDEVADGAVLVVDSYVHRADDRSVCRAAAVVAVDDLGRDLDVDVVVDPAPAGSAGQPHKAGVVLAGSSYALVDPHLDRYDPSSTAGEVEVAVVTTGAADTSGLGATVAADLAAALPGVTVRLVVGPWSCQDVPPGVEPLHAPAGLGPALAEADLVVTAGGVTMLEALRLCRPVVAVMTAENQRRYVEGAAEAGAVVASDPDQAAVVAATLARDPARRVELSRRGGRLVDGQGARRVAEIVVGLL